MSGRMKKHEPFIMDELLPSLFTHSAKVECDPLETALAVFKSLGTILLEQGFTSESLLVAIQCSALSTHNAPNGLQ